MEILFQTIGWEKYCLLKTPLKILVCGYGIPRCRCGSEEMENGDVYEKCTLCLCTMTTSK